jgi:hypothetical protein
VDGRPVKRDVGVSLRSRAIHPAPLPPGPLQKQAQQVDAMVVELGISA